MDWFLYDRDLYHERVRLAVWLSKLDMFAYKNFKIICNKCVLSD